MLAATVRVTRDLDTAEDAAQDAYVQALRAWERDGLPDRPGAWLTTVARRNALNLMRRQQTLEAKLPLLVEPEDDDMPEPAGGPRDAIPDDRLRLIFTCCHPALAPEAQVALTLRLVCGVATPDIARAFLVADATMAARLTRAKKKIAAARIPYAVPSVADLPVRVDAVLTVVHLLYSTGHTAPSGGDLVRDDLCERALDLARLLRRLLPDDREPAGLLALLLVHQARRATRTGRDGRLLRLEDQDRSLWDRELIAEADRLVVAALRSGPPGRFTLQAAIAALHAQAPTLRRHRLAPDPGPLRRAAAGLAVARGRASTGQWRCRWSTAPPPRWPSSTRSAGDDRLAGYRYLPATRADLLRRLGRHAEAADAYRAALALTDNAAEQEFLTERLRSAPPTA